MVLQIAYLFFGSMAIKMFTELYFSTNSTSNIKFHASLSIIDKSNLGTPL